MTFLVRFTVGEKHVTSRHLSFRAAVRAAQRAVCALGGEAEIEHLDGAVLTFVEQRARGRRTMFSDRGKPFARRAGWKVK